MPIADMTKLKVDLDLFWHQFVMTNCYQASDYRVHASDSDRQSSAAAGLFSGGAEDQIYTMIAQRRKMAQECFCTFCFVCFCIFLYHRFLVFLGSKKGLKPSEMTIHKRRKRLY